MDNIDDFLTHHDQGIVDPLGVEAPRRSIQPIFVQSPPVEVSNTSSPWSNIWIYIGIAFVVLLATYLAVSYNRDIKNRDTRNKRYNLDASVEFTMALANRLPKGHLDSKETTSTMDYDSISETESESYTDSSIDEIYHK